jgi:hypothetical protein
MGETFAILSGVIVLLAGPPYLIDIFKGKTKPQRTAWFIWTVLGVVAFVSQIGLKAHWSLVYVGLNALGNLIVFLLSFKYGVGGWKKLDFVALAIAAAGVGVSLIAKDPLFALFGVIVADFAGTVLTLYKTFLMPSSETSITWIFFGTSSLLGALSVGAWDFKLLLYPLYMAFATYSILIAQLLGLLLLRRTKFSSVSSGR